MRARHLAADAADLRRRAPVLVFHSVSDRPERSVWTVGTAEFRRILDLVADSGRTGITFGALAAALREGRTLPENVVCITFDDGFADNAEALGACAERGLPASVFVTTGYVGRPCMLDARGLRELAALPGAEIGSHTVTHRRLDELPRREIARELTDSRAALEDALSREVTTIAYPHGNYDRRVLELAAVAGYRGGAAVRMATARSTDPHLAVARYIVSAVTSESLLRRLVAGALPGAPSGERLRTRGFRLARRTRAFVRPVVATPPVP